MVPLAKLRCAVAVLVLGLLVVPSGRALEPADYKPVAAQLERQIRHAMEVHGLPAVSIALVDDQRIVWAKGFGNARKDTPATADTIYRVGSVSKLFTDIGVMRLVEQGKLDLDAPVSKVLPEFHPQGDGADRITLRMLMAHRSGLVREPPVGHYFDPTDPTLEATVKSLNGTKLVYPPEARIKYSNAAIATVGRVLEFTQKKPFPEYLAASVLEPMGLKRSSFTPTPQVQKDLADAVMWTYDGRVTPAPTFTLGMAPAGSMYTSVNELGRFLSILFAGGRGPNGLVLKPETLQQMWTPQFAKRGEKTGFGIGFHVAELDGKRSIGHGGAIYGFATELAALPDEKLGVVVVASRDCANAITRHLADVALRSMLAVRSGKQVPVAELSTALEADEAARLAGRYQMDDGAFVDLLASGPHLYALPGRGGFRVELRRLGDEFVIDDCLEQGTRVKADGKTVSIAGKTFLRKEVALPPAPPAHWNGLIGEYGWDHNVLYLLERDGKLHALIEWFFLYPLTEESPDVYRFPDWGLYDGEKLIFRRDAKGYATEVECASVRFVRRPIQGEDGKTFRIEPQRPLDVLRREALAAKPPEEKGFFTKPDLVELVKLDDTIRLDIRYATTNNFLGIPLYQSAKAFMQRPAAEALVRAHRKLAEQGYGLLIHDAYRPWYVTRMFWDATPQASKLFVADPSLGSRHNRGCAVDLTLCDRKTGKPVPMVAGYDEFSPRSFADYPGGTARQRWHRELLRRTMEAEGFTVYDAEWWHFDYRDWKKYPIQNLTFEKLTAAP